MSRAMRWFVLVGGMFLAFLAVAQQMAPGGLAQGVAAALTGAWPVKVTDGTNVQPTGDSSARSIHTTVDNASLAVTGTFWQATQPTSLAALPALAASTAKIGVVYPITSCGTTQFSKPLQAVPTSLTAVAAATTCITLIDFSNTSAGTLTLTATDNQGSPVSWLNAVSLNAGETRTYPFPAGKNFTSGLKLQASGVGIVYSAEGWQ